MRQIADILSASGRSPLTSLERLAWKRLRTARGGQDVRDPPSLSRLPPKMIRRIRSRRIALIGKPSGVNLTGVRPRFDVLALYAPTSCQVGFEFSELIRVTCISS